MDQIPSLPYNAVKCVHAQDGFDILYLLFKKYLKYDLNALLCYVVKTVEDIEYCGYLISMLVEFGADVNCKGPSGKSVLYQAAEHNAFINAETLVRLGADVNAVWNGKSILSVCLENDRLDHFRYHRSFGVYRL